MIKFKTARPECLSSIASLHSTIQQLHQQEQLQLAAARQQHEQLCNQLERERIAARNAAAVAERNKRAKEQRSVRVVVPVVQPVSWAVALTPFETKLQTLAAMGFTDRQRNTFLLQQQHGDLSRVCNLLL